MHQSGRTFLCLALLTLAVIGCSRQPAGESHFAKGLAYYKEGKFAKAAGHFENALATMQTNALALNFLGVCRLEEGETETGLKHLEDAVRLDPNYVVARYNLALAQLEQGRAEEAVANLRQVVQSSSAPPEAYYHLGLAYMHISAWGQAEEALKHHLQTTPNSADSLNCLGVVATRKREFVPAERYFEQCIVVDPKFATAYLNLASLENHHLGQKKEALAHYETYLGLLPKSQQREDVRLAVLQINQELATAAKQPVRTVETPAKPTSPPQPVTAETAQPAKTAAPQPEIVVLKPAPPPPAPTPPAPATTVHVQPAPVVAVATTPPPPPSLPVKKVRSPVTMKTLTPGNRAKASAYFNEGKKAQQQGNLANAIAGYGKAIATDPTYKEAYYNLAIVYRNAGQPERAMENYELALVVDPNYADAHFNYAIVLQEQGYIDDAISQFAKTLQANPNDAIAHLSIGVLYSRDRATIAKAREHFQTYLKLSPNSDPARNIRRWLDQNR